MKSRDPLATTMSMLLPVDRDGDKRDLRDANDQGLSEPRTRSKNDPMNIFQENLNGVNNVGPVVDTTKDVISSPMQGQRRASDGEYESVKRRDKV